MKNRMLFLIAFLLGSIGLNLKAQDKLFTPEDAAGVNPALFAAGMSQLQWMANQDVYTYAEGNFILAANPKKNQADTILDLSVINKGLISLNTDSLRRMPSIRWIDAESGYFLNQKKLFRLNLTSKDIMLITSFPQDAENIEIMLPTLNAAYTIKNNLFLAEGEKHTQITDEIDGIICGQSVHRNEFGISGGIFWSPDGGKIAFYRMDESMVTQYPLVDVSKRVAELKNERYPMAGMTSHEVSIGIYDLKSQSVVFLKTGLPADQYLTSVSWHPESKALYTALLSRDQKHMKLNHYDAATGEFVKTLFEEKEEKYVEPLNPMFFVPGSKDSFIWISQRDGFKHLYHYQTDGKLIRQLTSGEWVVTSFLGFDSKGSKAFFMATKESPLEQNAYSVDLKSGRIVRITPQKGVHRTNISHSGLYALDTYSNATVPRETHLLNAAGKSLKLLKQAENPLKDHKLGETSVFTIEATDGTPLFCRMIKPIDFDPEKKYPVVVYVYGGPHAQMITESWMNGANYYLNYLAQKGYIVFTLDNRGSDKRGRAFEQIIHRNLGKIEAEDQMQGISYLKSLPFVDAERIGVDGWSYGGFMSIHLKLNYPETFKVAVAGGPVTDWKYYEVMYGERYMDSPESNPDGYLQTSLINQAHKLEGKLLIIHGDMDPVVVWQHSLSFLKKCVDEGKLLDYFVYPGYEHNVRGRDRAHLIRKITSYFDENL